MARPHEPDPAPNDDAASPTAPGSELSTTTRSETGRSLGSRPRPGGTPQHIALPTTEVGKVVCRIDAATAFVVVASTPTPMTTWVADIMAAAQSGADPLEPWRTALREQQQRQVGSEPPQPSARRALRELPEHRRRRDAGRVPLHLPAAFVLQWWCEVVATPIAYAAALGPWLLVPETRALGFELASGLYPSRIVVRPEHTRVTLEPDPSDRGQRARAAYDAIVEPVVRGFAPEVRMGPRQRWGVVDDMWKAAARRAAGAAGESVGPEPVRTSCCFIFRLPGMNDCSSCPRGGPR